MSLIKLYLQLYDNSYAVIATEAGKDVWAGRIDELRRKLEQSVTPVFFVDGGISDHFTYKGNNYHFYGGHLDNNSKEDILSYCGSNGIAVNYSIPSQLQRRFDKAMGCSNRYSNHLPGDFTLYVHADEESAFVVLSILRRTGNLQTGLEMEVRSTLADCVKLEFGSKVPNDRIITGPMHHHLYLCSSGCLESILAALRSRGLNIKQEVPPPFFSYLPLPT